MKGFSLSSYRPITFPELGGFTCSNRYQSAIGPDWHLEGPGTVKLSNALADVDAKKGPDEVGALGHDRVRRPADGRRTSY